MIATFFLVILFIAGCLLAVTLLVAGFIFGMNALDPLLGGDRPRQWYVKRSVACLGSLVFGIAVVIAIAASGTDDGTHKWQGGNGPSTACHYEVNGDTVMVGKVAEHVNNLYTVCK